MLYHNRDASAAVGGELNLGGIDTEHFSGNLTYHQVVWETYWSLYIDRYVYIFMYMHIKPYIPRSGLGNVIDRHVNSS